MEFPDVEQEALSITEHVRQLPDRFIQSRVILVRACVRARTAQDHDPTALLNAQAHVVCDDPVNYNRRIPPPQATAIGSNESRSESNIAHHPATTA